MPEMDVPPEVEKKFHEWDVRQKYNPMETEEIEGNLRMTKVRRIIPLTSHYFSNAEERHQPTR